MSGHERVLAQTIADLQRRLRALERTGQLGNSAISGGALKIFDDEGNLRTLIGTQPDSTVTVTDHNGPPPPTPGMFTVSAHTAAAAVTWDGVFADGIRPDGTWGPMLRPSDFERVEIHAGQAPGYAQTDATQVGTFASVRGGTVMVPLGDGEWFISLQAVSTSGAESGKSVEVAVSPLPFEAPVRFHQDTKEVSFSGYDSYTVPLTYTPVAESEHVYWNGTYQEDARWDRDGDKVIVADTNRLVSPGDRLTVEYAHRDLPGNPVFNPVAFVRCTSVAMYGATSSLPAGTQIGDTIIVATSGNEKGYLTAGADQFHTTFTAAAQPDGNRIHLGVVKRLDKIGVMMGGQAGAASNHALVWTFRAALDGRVSSASVGYTGGGTHIVPPPGGVGAGFIGIVMNRGGIGGGYGGWNFANEGGGDWTRSCSDGTYHNLASAWTQQQSLPGGIAVTTRNTSYATAYVFGLQT